MAHSCCLRVLQDHFAYLKGEPPKAPKGGAETKKAGKAAKARWQMHGSGWLQRMSKQWLVVR